MEHSIKKVDFQGIEVRVIQVDGVTYIPGEDIGKMLGYEEPRRSVATLYKRYQEELEPHTGVITLMTPGGKQEVRCYNETGAYLIAMFARTPKAREVRQWLAELPKKVREFRSITEEEMKRIAEEAYRRGHEDGYRYAIEYEMEDEEEESEAEKALREVGWFLDGGTNRANTERHVDMARMMKAAQAGFDLACLHLHPSTLDGLLLAWTYDRGPLKAAFDNGLPVGTVKEVFQIFMRIGLPRHTDFKNVVWWDRDRFFVNESKFSYGAQTVLTRIYRLMMRIKTAIGENITEEKVFKELESNRPDWLLLTKYQVHIRLSVFSGTDVKISLQALGEEIFWPVRKYVYPRTKRAERTIAIPRALFYDRYFVCGERMFPMVKLDREAAKIHFLLKNYPREEAQEVIRMLEQGVQKKAH